MVHNFKHNFCNMFTVTKVVADNIGVNQNNGLFILIIIVHCTHMYRHWQVGTSARIPVHIPVVMTY